MKPLREIQMTHENHKLIDHIYSINDNINKNEQSSKRNTNNVGIIALTLLSYIIYIEFFKQNIPNLAEVSIGHALISESLYLGLQNVVNMYLHRLQ